MKKTLQDQYLLIKEGKGHKGVFLTEAKREFPHIVRSAATFEEAIASLKTKNIISENVISVMPAIMDRPKKESFETAFEAFLAEAKKKNEDEKVKAEEKKISKPVEEDLEKNFDYSDEKNPDNMIFDQIMMGYYAEMKDPKNADKTMQQLKDIVFKNLAKDPIYYTKDGQFGIKDLGYVTEHPGLGEPKPAKGKYASSGYGNLNESIRKYTKSEAYKLFDYHERTGMLPQGMTKEEFNKIMSYYNIKRNHDDSIDPAGGSGLYSHLEEAKLRKAIREIIDEELEEAKGGGNYGIYTINTSNKGAGEQKAPTYLILTPETMKAFNLSNLGPNAPSYDESLKIRHIIVSPSNTIFISDLLYITLEGMEKGRGTREKQIEDNKNRLKVIANEIPDRWWPSIRALFKKFAEPKTTPIPIKGKDVLYHQIRFKENKYGVETLEEWIDKTLIKIDEDLAKAASGEVRRGRPINVESLKRFKKQLEDMRPNASGGMAIIPPSRFDEGLESLRESVEKDLAAINKEAEHEVLQTKLDKIDALIDHRRSKLEKLDEDEDMKALTDKNKVKELEKDIKKLEVARKKVEKMMSKFKGKKSSDKEVIDEDEPIAEDLDVAAEYVEDATERLDAGQNVGSIGDTYSNMGRNQKSNLIDYLNTIAPDDLKSDYVY